MPANGRWDLIRRLKFNLFTYNYDFQVASTLLILHMGLMYIYSVIYGSLVLYFS